MTLEELKGLPEEEQRCLYRMFWSEFSAAKPDSKNREVAGRHLEQLNQIFGLDQVTWMRWCADAAARRIRVMLLLEDLLKSVA